VRPGSAISRSGSSSRPGKNEHGHSDCAVGNAEDAEQRAAPGDEQHCAGHGPGGECNHPPQGPLPEQDCDQRPDAGRWRGSIRGTRSEGAAKRRRRQRRRATTTLRSLRTLLQSASAAPDTTPTRS
jgi:hypothetical protein